MAGALRQVEERQLMSEIILMQWSPKMDVLAVANGKGEVALHRLTWQRVWILSPPKESDVVSNLSWRPDGKLIAITYKASNLLHLVDVENKHITYKTDLRINTDITCMSWLPLNTAENEPDESLNDSPTGEYLPRLSNLNRSFGQDFEHKEFLSGMPTILFIGRKDGNIIMYMYGMFYCGEIQVGDGSILEISGDAGKPLWAFRKDGDGIKVNRLSCPLLQSSDAFSKVARIHSSIECLMDYMSRTLVAISEAWETILLELDEKLARYAMSKPVGSVAADFLELLMIGTPSTDLESFLLNDLTEKGLKKLSHSIEMCYSNIQKLVLQHLHSVGMALVYQLAEMRGMARYGGVYESIGLVDESSITNAIHAAQAFLAKTSEIQQVIDHSMRDYKAFFRWLYVVILRLTDERVPPEIGRVSQQELTFIAEFLQGFAEIGSDTGRKRIILEKLGQYLRKEPLQSCLSLDGSEWSQILADHRLLQQHPLIVKQDLDYSLLQSHAKLVDAVNNVFSNAYSGLTNHFHNSTRNLLQSKSSLCAQIINSDGNLLFANANQDGKLLHLFKIEYDSESLLTYKWANVDVDNKQAPSTSGKSSNDFTISDLQFYSQEYLSLLLLNNQNSASYLIQLPINNIRTLKEFDENPDTIFDLNDLLGGTFPRPFQGMSAKRLAVSGARKVAAILSENNRKIRLLETEVEPEEEEDEDEDNETGEDSMMDVTGPVME